MADTLSSSYTLKFDYEFSDGDTRAVTLENPKLDLTLSDIETFETFLKNNSVVIGDKTGASFRGIGANPQIVTVNKRQIDLS